MEKDFLLALDSTSSSMFLVFYRQQRNWTVYDTVRIGVFVLLGSAW